MDEEACTKLFAGLADTYMLVDPSRGTCCQNECSSCSWHLGDGEYKREETVPASPVIVTYDQLTVPPASHTSGWASVLYDGKEKSSLSRKDFDTALEGNSELALDLLWSSWAPRGASTLSRGEVIRKLQSLSNKGAVPFEAFRESLRDAAKALASQGEDAGPDYESMETADLRALCQERGILKPPPVKRLICEELRFFDEHGRPGVRNKATRKLQ